MLTDNSSINETVNSLEKSKVSSRQGVLHTTSISMCTGSDWMLTGWDFWMHWSFGICPGIVTIVTVVQYSLFLVGFNLELMVNAASSSLWPVAVLCIFPEVEKTTFNNSHFLFADCG